MASVLSRSFIFPTESIARSSDQCQSVGLTLPNRNVPSSASHDYSIRKALMYCYTPGDECYMLLASGAHTSSQNSFWLAKALCVLNWSVWPQNWVLRRASSFLAYVGM